MSKYTVACRLYATYAMAKEYKRDSGGEMEISLSMCSQACIDVWIKVAENMIDYMERIKNSQGQ